MGLEHLSGTIQESLSVDDAIYLVKLLDKQCYKQSAPLVYKDKSFDFIIKTPP